MDKKVLALLCTLLMISTGYSQTKDTINVPEEVLLSFSSQYQDTSNVSWKKLDDRFIVEFLNIGDQMIAEFDERGQWLNSKETIMRRQVEDDLLDQVEEMYSDYDLVGFFKLNNKNGDSLVVFELKKDMSALYVSQNANGGFDALD